MGCKSKIYGLGFTHSPNYTKIYKIMNLKIAMQRLCGFRENGYCFEVQVPTLIFD